MDDTGRAIFVVLAIGFYLLPGIIGQVRQHHQRTAIWVLDIFLGWTFLAWWIALVWASSFTPRVGTQPPKLDLP